jgi:hypothetical protein
MHAQLPTRSITYANGDSGPRFFNYVPIPMGTLAQGSSTTYAKGDSSPRVFNNLCQWGLRPKGLQHPMPMGTLAQGSSTTYANGDSGPRVFNNLLLYAHNFIYFQTPCSCFWRIMFSQNINVSTSLLHRSHNYYLNTNRQ